MSARQAANLSGIFILSIFLLTGCKSKQETPVGQPPVKVSLLEVQHSNRLQELTYSGSIEPENIAQVGFAVPGVVNNITVQEGQLVAQGQLLATIDATEYANALSIADAGLEQAEDMFKRLSELYQKGSLPEKDYVDIKTKVAQARANKSINAKRIADSRLYAPMSGIVTAKLVERGSTAAPGIPAFTIVKTAIVYAKIAVPESEVGKLKTGMNATVFIPTLGDSAKGKIHIINPQGDATSKTYAVKILLQNNSNKLLPGMIAHVSVAPGMKEDIITIPATSVVKDADDIAYVFVANAQNRAIRKRISVGTITGNQEIVVKEGLTAGDRLVIAGQSRLKDGSPISY
ncbi:MAG: efflux RND transporter periplasmic adaptor subunit [Chitinophagaceae bacterium]|nr:efflux RND transporter periplasmic adaptor subunit [Chitinophagaceae bacterium]